LDIETIYVFINMLLDQWAFVATHIIGYKEPGTLAFQNLKEQLEGKNNKDLHPLTNVWRDFKEEFIWINNQLSLYRTRFVVHPLVPLVRGVMVYGPSGGVGLTMSAPSLTSVECARV